MLLPLLEGLAVERIVIRLAIYFHRLSECNTNVLVIGYYKNNGKSRTKYYIEYKTNVHAQNIVKNIYHNRKHFYLFMKNFSGEMKK